ncbi:MAG: hypothetical protein HZC49_10990, partial [Nitrospirae bacterium]|nr:hypothetical protein [Nitrospirota bacterium]
MNRVNVFIPAAGLGERLRPVTNYIPKPLIPVLGKPALQYVLDNVFGLPFNRIGINLHHRKADIEKWVSQHPLKDRMSLFPEREILGTGGALKNAEEFLREGTFLVHNSDILSDINLDKLLEYHFLSKSLVTLAVHDYPKFNTVMVDGKGLLRHVGVGSKPAVVDGKMIAFTGIAVYEPGFLDYLPQGKSSVVDAWLKATAEGKRIGTFDVCKGGIGPRPYWSDIGSPDAYAAAVFEMLRREGETVYIHPSITRCADAEMQGHVVIEKGCSIEGEIALKNCIVLPGGTIPPQPPLAKGGSRGGDMELPLQENCIIGPDFKINLNEKEILKISDDGKQLIGTGGSDRKYFRLQKDNKSVVLMQCKADDPDFERQIEYTRFFHKHSVPVPALIESDIGKKNALIEDAGDISLYSWLKCTRDTMAVEN